MSNVMKVIRVGCLSYFIKKIIYPIVPVISFLHKIEIFKVVLIGLEIMLELDGQT